MTTPDTPKRARPARPNRDALWFAVVGVIVLLAIGVVAGGFVAMDRTRARIPGDDLDAVAERGQVGDFYGGHLAAAGNLASFLVVLAALVLQTRELRLQRESLDEQREELADQTAQLTKTAAQQERAASALVTAAAAQQDAAKAQGAHAKALDDQLALLRAEHESTKKHRELIEEHSAQSLDARVQLLNQQVKASASLERAAKAQEQATNQAGKHNATMVTLGVEQRDHQAGATLALVHAARAQEAAAEAQKDSAQAQTRLAANQGELVTAERATTEAVGGQVAVMREMLTTLVAAQQRTDAHNQRMLESNERTAEALTRAAELQARLVEHQDSVAAAERERRHHELRLREHEDLEQLRLEVIRFRAEAEVRVGEWRDILQRALNVLTSNSPLRDRAQTLEGQIENFARDFVAVLMEDIRRLADWSTLALNERQDDIDFDRGQVTVVRDRLARAREHDAILQVEVGRYRGGASPR